MLKELQIENLAVIESASVKLGPHLNVFTGETGAGKSILIGGINAVLGQRVSRDIVRSGADKAYISAVFDDVPKAVSDKLREIGIDPEDELIISREISSDGRGTARINSRAASVSAIRELGDLLINIHGQHDSQILLDPSRHLEILDSFACTEEVLKDYRASFRELQRVAREISKLKQSEREKSERAAYLSGVVTEVRPLKLIPGEDEAVEERFRILDSSVELTRAIGSSSELLAGDDESENGALTAVQSALDILSRYDTILPALKPLTERLGSLSIEISDICGELTKLSESLEIDPEEYEKLSARRDDIARIKRRYGRDLQGIIDLYEKSADELAKIAGSDEELEKMNKEKDALLAEVSKKAAALREMRIKAAKRFKDQVEEELRFLNMPDVRIEVRLDKGKLTGTGMDSAEFLISANRGEEPKPVAKIASGGELSRIMLALKSVLSDRDGIPTLIFDEIDSGVSGRAAQKIGIKLREISRSRQVICVTHLAQIATVGDDHMLIEKSSESGRTSTKIRRLDFDGRKLEIARILGGDNITETVLKDAEEQLLTAQRQ